MIINDIINNMALEMWNYIATLSEGCNIDEVNKQLDIIEEKYKKGE